MDGMGHGMGNGAMPMSPPDMNGTSSGMPHMDHHGHGEKMMMHMTLYWGKEALVLFAGWPGQRTGMYVLALILVFAMAVLVEWLSHSRLIKSGSNHVAAGLAQTVMHAIRMGLAYLLMLALMSFNGGIFIAGVAGHAVGFLFFGSRIFNRDDRTIPGGKHSDLPPISC